MEPLRAERACQQNAMQLSLIKIAANCRRPFGAGLAWSLALILCLLASMPGQASAGSLSAIGQRGMVAASAASGRAGAASAGKLTRHCRAGAVAHRFAPHDRTCHFTRHRLKRVLATLCAKRITPLLVPTPVTSSALIHRSKLALRICLTCPSTKPRSPTLLHA